MEQTLRCIVAGKLEDIPKQSARVLSIEGKEIAVFRLSSGEVRALENKCPHKGGQLAEGIVAGEFVFCPLHDWKIGLCDGKAQAPDEGCVKTFQVEVVNGLVHLYLEN